MVLNKTHKRAPITLIVALVFLAALMAAFATCAIIRFLNDSPKDTPGSVVDGDDIEPEEIINEPEILKVDFQPTIDNWVYSMGGSKGVIIYDLDLDEVVGEYNADTKFQTASLYKLFVVYEGYRRVQNGSWDGNAVAGWTGRTILECLDLAIRESYSPCAETLWNMIGHEELNQIVQSDFGITTVAASSLSATSREIMEMMKLFYEHPDITREGLIITMKDSFLNQPITTYNWRQGLPSGFSDLVNVYNKVGWNWNGSMWTIYDDAAIIEFVEEERNFIVVVMSSGVNYSEIRRFGSEFEAAFRNALISAEEL